MEHRHRYQILIHPRGSRRYTCAVRFTMVTAFGQSWTEGSEALGLTSQQDQDAFPLGMRIYVSLIMSWLAAIDHNPTMLSSVKSSTSNPQEEANSTRMSLTEQYAPANNFSHT